MERLSEGDEYFDRLRDEAKKECMVVRYVGVLDVKAGKVEAKLNQCVLSLCYEMEDLADTLAGIRLIILLRHLSGDQRTW